MHRVNFDCDRARRPDDFLLTEEFCFLLLQIWDTAGQERYHSMLPMYYRNTHAAILVFDLTDYKSFVEMKQWVTELRRFVPTYVLMAVVGNKSDLHEQRKIDTTEAQSYATQIGAMYHETSVILSSGINAIFEQIAADLIEREAANNTNADFENICLSPEKKLKPKLKNKCCNT